jgi:hypothetical protein
LNDDTLMKPFSSSILNSTNKSFSNKSHNKSLRPIVEIDLTTGDVTIDGDKIKQAKKRHTSQSNVFEDENENEPALSSSSNVDFIKKELLALQNIGKLGQDVNRLNRTGSEKEKYWHDQLTKNSQILNSILNKSQSKSNELMMEEERYKLKKRSRLEKERTEKELAQKFSQQLHLETKKLCEIYIQEDEPIEIEDEFPGIN